MVTDDADYSGQLQQLHDDIERPQESERLQHLHDVLRQPQEQRLREDSQPLLDGQRNGLQDHLVSRRLWQ